MQTVWERIFYGLKKEGINVFPPATKIGECKEEYVVVKQEGSSQAGNFSSEYHYYSFMLYVPQNKYQDLERLKEKVKKAVSKNLNPILMPTGLETPDFFDDTVKAHMSTIQYRNNVRNKFL